MMRPAVLRRIEDHAAGSGSNAFRIRPFDQHQLIEYVQRLERNAGILVRQARHDPQPGQDATDDVTGA